MDRRLTRSPLKSALGDASHSVMSDAAHKVHKILAKLDFFAPKLA